MQDNAPANGGDDDFDDDAIDEACPSRHEVLLAASTISRYLDLEADPLARKLDNLLISFKHKLHIDETNSIVPTLITDYFTFT